MALENPKMHSALRIATTTNPFLGDDEVALDVQMHSAAGSGNGLGIIYSIFSFRRRGIVWMEARRLTGKQRAKQNYRIRRRFRRI